MSDLDSVLSAAAEVQSFCESQHWKFCFIGGVAVQRWGMPRFTQDVDITLLTELGNEAPIIDATLAKFAGRLKNARQFALEHRVLLAHTTSGIAIDIALGAFPFEQSAVERATRWKISAHLSITTCSAEDLIIYKVFASRDRDWSDVETILVRQHKTLDVTRIRQALPELLELKDDLESFPKFEKMAAKVAARLSDAG